MWRRILLLVLLAACGNDTTPLPDLSMPGDLSMSLDLSANLDLTSTDFSWACNAATATHHCLGTRLEGTCAALFFDCFLDCFHPTGNCAPTGHNTGSAVCWEDGSAYFSDAHQTPYEQYYPARADRPLHNLCMTHFSYSDPNLPTDQFCMDSNCGAGPAPHGGATYDARTGIFTCPDGTHVDLGLRDLGIGMSDCPELNARLDPVHQLCNGAGVDGGVLACQFY